MTSVRTIPRPAEPSPLPRAIHRHPCSRCPADHGARRGCDPEAIELIAAPRAIQLGSVFRCSRRPEKLRKGWCDVIGVPASDLGDSWVYTDLGTSPGMLLGIERARARGQEVEFRILGMPPHTKKDS